ncbi:MAG TPA: oxygen-dependent coproporphyrinogen oxidase [Candidatus Acidoferrales bacterium]|nr:oxygen-dependent coproporphyrinogen oxidase [Candidatus Acidoferrales bacterium]
MKEPGGELGARMRRLVEEQQTSICAMLAQLDGKKFSTEQWSRDGGGGGLSAILSNGDLFEKAGVNTSAVWGELDDRALAKMAGTTGAASDARIGRDFFATGISLVLHPRSPMVPTLHANFRFLTRGDAAWFGGGSDLTPYYPRREDVVDFHRAWKAVCDRHDPGYYPRFKQWCDEYFTIVHRHELRGVGGIFFDDLAGDLEATFRFVADCCTNVLEPYVPIVSRRREDAYGERERDFQSFRRGRYVEFNLVYDRGTAFGLATGGRTESILMSLPPLASWPYGYVPEQGSREAEAMRFFQPRDWLG